MAELQTLRRELILALAVVFAFALLVFALGVFLWPSPEGLGERAVYNGVLVLVVVAIFALISHIVIQRSVVRPIREMVAEIETIAGGQYDRRLAEGDTRELSRLAAAVNHMAERLITDQAQLAANIQSLDGTNRLLTEARDAMVRAEKMASVGRLSAGIAHEVGNPLGAILGYLGLLSRSANAQKRELIEAADREARRIDRIVRGLLDYARPRDTKSLEMNVNRVLHDTLELMETQGRWSGIELQVQLAPTVPAVLGDPYQLQQVLVNLLVNALECHGGYAAAAHHREHAGQGVGQVASEAGAPEG